MKTYSCKLMVTNYSYKAVHVWCMHFATFYELQIMHPTGYISLQQKILITLRKVTGLIQTTLGTKMMLLVLHFG